MSHQRERKEKDCLNCGTTVQGRFCHVCGQENIVVKQGVISLGQHFIYDLFHFDGKFFDTLRRLFFKPGFVPSQYVSGKRLSFLDPIRMYLFTSAVFFLLFFSFSKFNFSGNGNWDYRLNREERMNVAYELREQEKKAEGSTSFNAAALQLLTDSTYRIRLNKVDEAAGDSVIKYRGEYFQLKASLDTNKATKDSLTNNNFINKGFARMNEKFKDDPKKAQSRLFETFLHRLPYMLFISLPFFAVILKLLYIRRRNFFYSDHFIFTLYHYIFSFILILVFVAFAALEDWSGWKIFNWMAILLLFYWMIHLYLGMKTFYGQGHAKTITKFLLLNILGTFVIFLLFLIFLLITAFQM